MFKHPLRVELVKTLGNPSGVLLALCPALQYLWGVMIMDDG